MQRPRIALFYALREVRSGIVSVKKELQRLFSKREQLFF